VQKHKYHKNKKTLLDASKEDGPELHADKTMYIFILIVIM